MKFSYELSVSCMDQIDDQACYIAHGDVKSARPEDFLDRIRRETEAAGLIASYGATRNDVRMIAPEEHLRRSA